MDPKRVMASQSLRLSCNVDVEKELENDENIFWKLCEWTHPNKEVCSQFITNNQRKKKRCKGVFENVTVEDCGEKNRLKCCINLPLAQESDKGKWKCKLHKCKDVSEGGCSSELESDCTDEIIVNVTVCLNPVLN